MDGLVDLDGGGVRVERTWTAAVVPISWPLLMNCLLDASSGLALAGWGVVPM